MLITPLHPWIGQKIGRGPDFYSRADLECWQLERLQLVIRYVRENSPFYRNLFSGCPENLVSLPDLADYPFTHPRDIQEDPNRFICVHPDEIERIVTLPTSGTTGPSKRIFFTAADQELTIDFFQMGMSTLARPNDRVLILLPGRRPGSVGDLLRLGLERLGCIPIPYGAVDDEGAVLRMIREKDVNVMVGAPIQLHRLARWDQVKKILPKEQIRSLLASTDTLADTVRTNLQEPVGLRDLRPLRHDRDRPGRRGGMRCPPGLSLARSRFIF
ncbi:MAG: hypothetical protein AB9891_04725 [Anaerolineaceae bacterium]